MEKKDITNVCPSLNNYSMSKKNECVASKIVLGLVKIPKPEVRLSIFCLRSGKYFSFSH
jgi:hypothetical protein